MTTLARRDWLLRACAVAATPLAPAFLPGAAAQEGAPQVVRIVAERFRYTPAEFHVQAGRPVVLEFSARDFVHGFSMPDLGVRADLPPGQVTRVRLLPRQPGSYDFLCDNFCGDGHERMHGRMVADDPGAEERAL